MTTDIISIDKLNLTNKHKQKYREVNGKRRTLDIR